MSKGEIYKDGTYLKCNPTWHEEDSAWKANQIINILAKNGVTPSTIAEVGCGAGKVLRTLADHFGDTVTLSGFEISPQAFEICVRNATANAQFFLEDLLGADRHFDVVLAIDVFEHVEDYMGFLRALREKGELKVFHIPLDLSAQAIIRIEPIMHARSAVGHLHYFAKETALATLRDCGYEIIDSIYTCGAIDLPSTRWKMRLLKIPRRMFFAVAPDLAARTLGGFSLLVLAR